MRRIYLDYNATTPVAPSVTEAMRDLFAKYPGNPSSSHYAGIAAREAVMDARSQMALMLGCDSEEVVFTSCGTESNNLALKGLALNGSWRAGGHLVISSVEHPAVVQPVRWLEQFGFEVTVVPSDRRGVIDPEQIAQALRRDTRVVSVMLANNEIGTIQPVREIADFCHRRGILVHTDAAQAVGKIPVRIDQLEVDLLSIAGHKFYAPKGVGALFVREGLSLTPLLHGGDQEHGLRGGTENVPYLIGMGRAANLATKSLDEVSVRMEQLRDELESRLLAGIDGLVINGSGAPRLPNTSSVVLPRVSAQALLQRVETLAASTGSACHTGLEGASGTLRSLGLSPDAARGTLRLSIGWQTSREEVELAADWIIDAWDGMVA
ncbi:MAG TPA: cysteine desulfurase family protein [Pirellulaceae bacterium]|nr:cysteine desulfurase family protein [Pirellulaceae bacterium]